MEWYVVLIGMLTLLSVLIAIGLPIPFAMAASCLPFLWSIQSWNTSLVSTQLKLWGVWVDYVLLAVPLFVFLGELVSRSAIGARMYQVMHHGVPMRGAAAYGSVGACAGFGAVCGSSLIGALTIGSVAVPEMLRLGYSPRLVSGVVAAGGTLSVLIPPSLILIFYAIVTDASVGQLFIAGVIPGLILTFLYLVVVKVWSIVRPQDVPAESQRQRLSLGEIVVALGPVALIATIIIVSIYFGIATTTESAAVANVVTIVLAFTVGGMSPREFLDALVATLRTMGFIGILLAAAALFGFVLTYYRVPQELGAAFAMLNLPPYAVLLSIIVFYLIVGMFLEPASITFITVPTIFPLVAAAGYDLIWFGIIYTITMEIAVLTPPVGLNLYVLQRLDRTGRLRLIDAVLGSIPFIGVMLLLIGLLIALPGLALWLPGAMK
ncbi:MAG: TRAP transporter large permease [Planctomycetota bacterium]